MVSKSSLIVHRGVALMVCESAAILEETLVAIDTSGLHIQRIGDRAIVAPAYQLEEIRSALQERGTFPRVTGKIVHERFGEEEETAAELSDNGPGDKEAE